MFIVALYSVKLVGTCIEVVILFKHSCILILWVPMATCLWQDSTFVSIVLDGGFTLTGKDLYILTEILRPATPQWKTVGLALGFLDYELATIEHKPSLIPEGPSGYFREMLSQWLKWAPPKHSSPTLESLAPALQSSGHEDLAVKLRTSFLQKKGKKIM